MHQNSIQPALGDLMFENRDGHGFHEGFSGGGKTYQESNAGPPNVVSASLGMVLYDDALWFRTSPIIFITAGARSHIDVKGC